MGRARAEVVAGQLALRQLSFAKSSVRRYHRKMDTLHITANLVDVVAGHIVPAAVSVRGGRIVSIDPVSAASGYLIPGFVDAHVHIESSMLLPCQFAQAAVVHGTVATVSDPHEIANVCGLAGIELMLRSAAETPFKFHFGAPSCVPATSFESAGACIDLIEVERLLDDPRINHLSEIMNFPGVISGQPDVLAKIQAAISRNLPVDGHAPGLRGDALARYLSAGISTDHESTTLAEARDKVVAGCSVAIREGSAARNFDALWPLIDEHPAACMFCSDDKHPDDLLIGHINQLATRAIRNGCDLFDVLRVASMNPIRHYGLDVGLLQCNDPADFLLVEDLQSLRIRETYIGGQLVARDGTSLLPSHPTETVNCFCCSPLRADDIRVEANQGRMRVIAVTDGQLVTDAIELATPSKQGRVESDVTRDILKLVVVNRYKPARPAVAFVQGFGFARGAIASSVAHDSHNIIAVGTNDQDLLAAINAVIHLRGALAVSSAGQVDTLPLPIGGLMSAGSCADVAAVYTRLDQRAKQLGCGLRAPFMTLSFLALPVIPSLKLCDLGLFDVDKFDFVSLFV